MKRKFALILAALMFSGCVSCGDTNSTHETTPAVTDETTINEADDIYSVLETQDFGETQINILGYGVSNAYNDADSFGAEQTGEVIDDAIYQRNIETEQLLNVKLVFDASLAERDSQARFNNGVLAGDNVCDIFYT